MLRQLNGMRGADASGHRAHLFRMLVFHAAKCLLKVNVLLHHDDTSAAQEICAPHTFFCHRIYNAEEKTVHAMQPPSPPLGTAPRTPVPPVSAPAATSATAPATAMPPPATPPVMAAPVHTGP
eukprot:5682660-Pleurochrysis_carterae.AAC.1